MSPGIYFRLLVVGYFEGLSSERVIELDLMEEADDSQDHSFS